MSFYSLPTTDSDKLREIARRELRISTLDDRNLDRLDFHDLGVASIRDALAAAYRAGQRNPVAS